MFERSLNVFWILLGAASATYAWTLGLAGPSGPESGLFPFIAALIVMGAGVVLLLWSPSLSPEFPQGAALVRVLGVIAGLAFMAISISYLGFERQSASVDVPANGVVQRDVELSLMFRDARQP